MNQKLIRQIGRTRRLDVLAALKRQGPRTVRELAAEFGRSYMGIKQHCLDLEKQGYLDTWRRPSRVGRPELLYRLTARGLEVFSSGQNALTVQVLEAVQGIYGPAAPTKILFGIFAHRAEVYRRQVVGLTLQERGAALAELREAEGYMAAFGWEGEEPEAAGPERRWCIVEYHSPIQDLLRRFPVVARLERELFERVLQFPVRREEPEVAPGYYQCVFYIG